jgi:hypothetical protein
MRRVPVIVAVVALSVLVSLPAHAQRDDDRDKNCELSSSGTIPLTDLGADTYQGAQGGLYPQGSNEIPPAHLALGLERAADIVPRNEAGEPDPDGLIVFVAVGYSNTSREFREFEKLLPGTANLAADVVFVNAGQGGQHVLTWTQPGGRPWTTLDEFLARESVTAEQVQGAWINMAQRVDAQNHADFPETALTYRDAFITVAQLLKEELPNLQVGYVTSRVYGGYNAVSSPSPEPVAYEEGFGVKWAIETQIAGDPILNADPDQGDVVAPWLAWGPYIWADGTTPRSDGLTWPCSEMRGDGVHLNDRGNDKVAGILMEFLQQEPTAAWMFSDRELPAAPTDLGDSIPTSTIPGDPGPGDFAPPSDGEGRVRGNRGSRDGDAGGTTTATPSTAAPPDTAAAPEPTGTEPPSAAPSPDATEDLPAVVWAVGGAAVTLVLVGSAGLIMRRRRPTDGEPPV